ncbi:aminotransferase class IV [Zavarzinia compransoris]|uniref:aminotransferase class IV n=1 Tax=Zavarzinia marina TaxID=2911065 RepID=UPI001F28AE1E|nr:aminotransferase class IV [Zavarzinia marina]MCF4165559.1 aminotransferase class IV [Zavarzinia marina]
MIWFDGTVRPAGPIPLDPGDRGLLLGDGVFETVLVLRRRPVDLEAHLGLLRAAGETLGFAAPPETLRRAVADLVAAMPGDHGVIRLTVSRGAGPRGLRPPPDPAPVVLATLAPWTPAMAFLPVALATVGIRRNETSPLSRIKSLSYLDNVLAHGEARRLGADDALVLNTRGGVAGSAMANLFAVIDGRAVTPPVADGVRPGTIRRRLLEGAGAVEASLTPERIAGHALFLTNSLRLIAPVSHLDGQPLPPPPPGFAADLSAALGLS